MESSIYVTIRYDKELESITRIKQGSVVMFQNEKFSRLLAKIFLDYPEIDKKYKPGQLGLLVNGIPPTTKTVLRDGDIVDISIHL